MTYTDLLAALRGHSARLTIEGAELIVESDAGPLPDDLLAELRAHKPELLAALNEQSNTLSPELAEPVQEVVRLRLVLEAEDGRRTEAILAIPRERYDGMAALEAFDRHRTAGTTRVVAVQQIAD